MSDPQSVAEELIESRRQTGLSRERVGAKTGMSAKSIERYENGEPVGPERLRKLRSFYAEVLSGALSLDSDESNGTPSALRDRAKPRGSSDRELPRQLELMALEFERDMVEADVDQDFRRYARARLRDPELLEMYAGGHTQRHMSAEDQLADYEDLLDELRGRLKRRLALLKQRRGK